ncbi:YbjO family protein [Candidatus Poribacteria bacterium]
MISVVLAPIVCGIGMVSGIAILKGRNWGRILYLCSIPVFALYSHLRNWSVYGSPFRFTPGSSLSQFILRLTSNIPLVILYIVVLVFLTRATASSFFAGRTFNELEPEE